MKTLKHYSKRSVILLVVVLSNLNTWAQADYYWVGGSGNWSDYANHWATTSGGSSFHTTIPDIDDNVYFDENSFTGPNQVVTLDISGFTDNRIHNMDWRGSTNSPSLVTQAGTSNYLRIHGSVYFHENMTVDVVRLRLQIFSSGVNAEFDPGGVDLSNTSIDYQVTVGGSSLSFLDSISAKVFETGNNISGYVTTNGYSINVSDAFKVNNFILTGGVLDFSNSDIYAKSFEVSSSTIAGELNTDNASVTIIYPDGFTKIQIESNDPLFENYTIREDHLISKVYSLEATSWFDSLIIEPGVDLTITSTLFYVNVNQLIANGTDTERISIKSDDEGIASIISGSVEITFNYVDFEKIVASGDATFNAIRSRDLGSVNGINFVKLSQEVTFNLEVGDLTYENVGDVIPLTASSSTGMNVTFTSSDEDVALISGANELLIVGAGTSQITAVQSGDEFYATASKVRLLQVDKLSQAITFDQLEDTWAGDGYINLTGSSDSGLPVTYSNVIGPAILNGQSLEFTGAGTVQVTASQEGNANYLPAPDVSRTFTIYKKSQQIAFNELQDISEDEGFVNLDASADSGLPINYSVVGPGDVVDGVLEFTGSGMIQVTALQNGNEWYLAAEEVHRSFEILASTSEKPLSFTQSENVGMIYPNPVENYIYFNPSLKVKYIRLSDTNGKVYFKGKPESDFMDLTFYEPGIYVLTILLENDKRLNERIIKH